MPSGEREEQGVEASPSADDTEGWRERLRGGMGGGGGVGDQSTM